MKRIEKMIPSAIASVITCEIAKEKRNEEIDKAKQAKDKIFEVDSEFNGYISSLGASIVYAGLLPTMVFFSTPGGSKVNRPAIIKAIEHILKENSFLENNERLLETIKELVQADKNAELARLGDLIADAAVALKLAVRTYPEKPKN